MNATTKVEITQEEITRRAHDIWERSGRPEGEAIEHWLRAERELRAERGGAAKPVRKAVPRPKPPPPLVVA